MRGGGGKGRQPLQAAPGTPPGYLTHNIGHPCPLCHPQPVQPTSRGHVESQACPQLPSRWPLYRATQPLTVHKASSSGLLARASRPSVGGWPPVPSPSLGLF